MTRSANQLSPMLMGGISVWLLFHFASVLCSALAAPSGPWPTPDGENLSTPPQFAHSLHTTVAGPYLKALHLVSNYHFLTNRPGLPGVRFEAHFKDAAGQVVKVQPYPDPEASRTIRHRQGLLARWLANDLPVAAPTGEAIPAPNQPVAQVVIWSIEQPQHLRVQATPVHLIPRDRPVMRPSELSLSLARSYARYQCRSQGATRVEIVRCSQEALPPVVLYREELQNAPYPELIAAFGDYPK